MSAPRTVVIDTNVIIDAFVRSGDGRSQSSIELLRRVEKGDFIAVLPTPVLVEIYYVVMDVTKDPGRAQRTLRTLLLMPNVRVQAVERDHALAAIEIIQEGNYVHLGKGTKLGRRSQGLSMVDSLVLAIGHSIPGAVVCSNERHFSLVRSVRTMRPRELLGIPEGGTPVNAGRP